MTTALTWADIVLTLLLLPFIGLMAAIAGAALVRGRRAVARRDAPPPDPRARFLVIVPAHDEAAVIARTVRSCREVDYPPDLVTLVVIADNCTDETARIAREAGATVVERHDDALRSKGHALRYLFDRVADGTLPVAYDAAVLIDADTCVARDLLGRFAESLAAGDDWVQGYYTVQNPDVSWRTRMMTYAFSLANGAWMLGLDRLGLGVGLKGNGMCFSRAGLARFPWQAHGLVEDMEFAYQLRVAGERVRFLPSARVYGEMVSRGGPGAASQRRRWEAGRRELRGRFRDALLRSPRLSGVKKVVYLIDLYYPPLSTLAAGVGLGAALDLVLLRLDPGGMGLPWLAGVHASAAVVLVAYALGPIVALGLPVRYLMSVAWLPYFMVWKVTTRATRRPQGWMRTPREAQSNQ